MEALINKKQELPHQKDKYKTEFTVVHPLFDKPEQKVDIENAGPMHVTRATWFALFALRAYLLIMILLAVYRFMVLAGILKS
ncbi:MULTISPECIES: hypothetical protein [unclassified Mucilaginibacter]|uniref:hypothetical protein n=1 Tax=unclassified Mucilaginibacter TaxID=2617802 RepID=UPI0009594701|nr:MULTISPECIES: hypothetical protein [unclassified Mucilaginibacter]OJW18186.1 MAG: hypothetical protein BGO48_16625 [Mucilaginibacter sp. 44-25]PLW89547.1 MAG: hypothetical protein C0154_11025 [Mucilaginibacter sp.]HEK19427.1 hypothetical protein [Bacteroidota bacterium]